jgi:hypothetical protein
MRFDLVQTIHLVEFDLVQITHLVEFNLKTRYGPFRSPNLLVKRFRLRFREVGGAL